MNIQYNRLKPVQSRFILRLEARRLSRSDAILVEALQRIAQLVGQDLRPLADQYKVTVWREEGKKNKGWAGHTIERFLGLPLNSSQSPNFASWELKVIPLVPRRAPRRRGELRVKRRDRPGLSPKQYG